ncbi:fibrous sheath CABYR-binding protein-like [Eupeodes corollae]|uniref:fibrous sheath CABYR-binding protein-like n=1 Tax=Eupeodes corollae TaxID=290404 RepID=UPI00248FB2D7|nr:fibrous sheath CABYR-binding protein-like [Eupeodes corollae]
MRTFVLVCLFAVAATAAVLPEASYIPPEEKLSSEYLPPSDEVAEVKEASADLTDDGYRYKTVRKLKYRQRRDVSELPAEYLPPSSQELSSEYISPAEVKEAEAQEAIAPEDSAVLGDDGYRYKTIRKLKYRQRRDVSEIIAPEYLPPAEEAVAAEYIQPAEVKEAVEITEVPEESAALAEDGYRYKTIRKLKYRQRRDVSEIIAPEYLPPVEEAVAAEYIPPAEVKEAVEATEVPEESAALAEDGYRYKTIRKLKYRQRRDVSEINAPEYLPPAEEAVAAEYIPPAEVKEAVEVTEVPEESAALAEDGYRYKTIRKLKYRQRRDVSEIIAPEYLPPVEEAVAAEYIPPAEVKEAVEATEIPEESSALAEDGYRYKTIRKLKYRQRRDVSEIVSPQYLPPSEEAPSSNYIPPAEVKEAVEATEAPEESAILADDGYRYKTIRKLKYRHRRDVSEIIAPEYLPPVEKSASEYLPPTSVEEVAEVTEIPAEKSAILADDGYRYKTVKRIRYRH